MFRSARLKLTTWYSLIIMVVSISFSAAMYQILTHELDRIEIAQRFRIEHEILDPSYLIPPRPLIDPDVIDETKHNVQFNLIMINFIILAGSALAGYFLAGRTLKPIKNMVDDQNRFITDASHELRTPITSLKSEIEVNLRDPGLSLPAARTVLKSNLEEADRLQTLTDGLIKLTQFSDHQTAPVLTPVSLSSLISAAVEQLKSQAKIKQIKVIGPETDLMVMGNPAALTELITILLDNAIKYSPTKASITLNLTPINHEAELRVIDQGPGISAIDLPHIFNRFYRADKSRSKAAVNGYGLGLSIARQIALNHHGHLTAESTPGQGSTFILKLPLSNKN